MTDFSRTNAALQTYEDTAPMRGDNWLMADIEGGQAVVDALAADASASELVRQAFRADFLTLLMRMMNDHQ